MSSTSIFLILTSLVWMVDLSKQQEDGKLWCKHLQCTPKKVIDGSNVWLNCPAEERDTVIWFHYRVALRVVNDGYFFNRTHLLIRKITSKKAGVYKCETEIKTPQRTILRMNKKVYQIEICMSLSYYYFVLLLMMSLALRFFIRDVINDTNLFLVTSVNESEATE